MKKTKQIAALIMAALMTAGSGMTVFAATAQDVINMNPTSYTAGTSSVYGPSLTQDQLNQVAQAVANFTTNYINDSMDNDTKIKAAYDYLVNNVSYIDWNQGEGANAAFGALVRGQAACSGYARAFKALCDAMGVSCYYIHSTGNDHQWNMVEFNDGYYFVDVEANDSSGFDWIYHSSTHPYAYDTAAFPAIGSKSGQSTSGTTATEGWKQDSTGWWWRNADGSYPTNQWKEVGGKYYYFGADGYMAANKWIDGTYYVGSDGAMLTNTTTPDGYQVGADGAWVQDAGQTAQQTDGVHTMRASQISTATIMFNDDELPEYQREVRNGFECIIMDRATSTFSFPSNHNTIDPTGHEVWVYAATAENGIPFVIGEPIIYNFEYDKKYSIDFTGKGMSPTELADYCDRNNLMIDINIVDKEADFMNNSGHNSLEFLCAYANANSVLR